ncbi:MAG: HmuY family protein [Weeksellaceae bacterium]
MKNWIYYLCIILGLSSCAVEEDFDQNPFVIAFEKQSTNYFTIHGEQIISLVLSESAKESGFVRIKIDPTDTTYGEDFITYPEAESNMIIVPFNKHDTKLSFTFHSLIESYSQDDQKKKVAFIIEEINYRDYTAIQGYAQHIISFNSILGGTVAPEVGGPNQPNQVYYDLSTGESVMIRRDAWDLGFYGGEDFRVILNGSLYMATKSLDIYDIDAVNLDNIPSNYFDEVKIGTFDPANEEFIDSPSGDINGTAIQEIEVEPVMNPVYLVNLGNEVGTITPNVGSVAVAGDERGWKKIRILRQENGYLLQYANLNDTTHQEIFISKEKAYNFTHFSFNTEKIIQAQPPRASWDLCFTVFTNVVSTPDGESAGSYGFSDFVVNNVLSDSKGFMVLETNEINYDNYSFNRSEANSLLSDDQRVIGSNWRDVFKGLYDDRFFVLHDTEGNWYKIKFISFTGPQGERGYPKFQYQQIN